MNFTKNTMLTVSAVLALGLAMIAGACQTAGDSRPTGAANQPPSNSNTSHGAGSMSNMSMHSGHDMAGMNHGDMQNDPNASTAPYDLQFLDTMVHHHQGALEMAEMAVRKTSSDELRQFARKMIDDQTKEIAQMKDWREKWYAGKPRALNMDMQGMRESMKTMAGAEMKKMEAAAGTDFDLLFIEMMTPHHAGAVDMSLEALKKAEHLEIKTLANQIITEQKAEIKKMSDWKTARSK